MRMCVRNVQKIKMLVEKMTGVISQRPPGLTFVQYMLALSHPNEEILSTEGYLDVKLYGSTTFGEHYEAISISILG